ncbi:MAG: ElyC/SanA/YdcF family protein [Kiritimatiellales bacterium]
MKLFRKTAVWMPTGPGLLILLLIVAGLGTWTVCHLYPFLAQTRPQPAPELVIVEGWMADDEIRLAAGLVQPGQTVISTGGPVTFGQKILNYDNYAELGAIRLAGHGIPADSIITVPAPDTERDRTYVSAIAARARLEELGLFGKPANLVTVGAHARRSYLLYKDVFGRDYPLGIISVEPDDYHLDHWYLFSAGVKHVGMEFISWIYAEIFVLFK